MNEQKLAHQIMENRISNEKKESLQKRNEEKNKLKAKRKIFVCSKFFY